MTYRVILQRLAIQDLDDAFVWAARKAPATAARWLDRFQAALQRLDTNPQRCPRAREHRKVDVELREVLFGKYPPGPQEHNPGPGYYPRHEEPQNHRPPSLQALPAAEFWARYEKGEFTK